MFSKALSYRNVGPSSARAGLRAFTLIELLVVIAIIALLISILLPALSKARTLAKMVKSMSNERQANIAFGQYRLDSKGYAPAVMSWTRTWFPPNPLNPAQGLEGLATWGFGGKNNDASWAGRSFDIEAADRPLNQYLVNNTFDAPARPQRMTANDPRRTAEVCEVLNDPSDRVTYQRAWNPANPTPTVGVSSYEDVGTSYHYQVKWFDPIYAQWTRPTLGGPFFGAFNFGAQRLRVSDGYVSSKMVWLNDQYADVVANCTNPGFRLKNGYGDINKSVMAFLDGHVDYLEVYPGATPRSFKNENYHFVFENLRVP